MVNGKLWTEDEISYLISNYRKSKTAKEIAKYLNRGVGSVFQMVYHLDHPINIEMTNCLNCGMELISRKNWRKSTLKLCPNCKKDYKLLKFKLYQERMLDEKREEIFLILGNKCKECGISDKRVLQIDHINDDGSIDREMYKGLKKYNYILSLPEEEIKSKYQTYCANCNIVKQIEKIKSTGVRSTRFSTRVDKALSCIKDIKYIQDNDKYYQKSLEMRKLC
jgi:hypothetical protein